MVLSMRKLTFPTAVLCMLLLWSACGSDFSDRMRPKPSAFGPLNKMVVVAEPLAWNELSDTVKYFFAAPYPILPQPEPLFDIMHYSPEDLAEKSGRRHLRTYLILVDASDTTSRSYKMARSDLKEVGAEGMDKSMLIKVARDKWAKNQLLVYVVAENTDLISTALTRNHSSIIDRIRKFEASAREGQIYTAGRNVSLSRMVADSLGVGLEWPKSAQVARVNRNVAWVRMETEKSSSSVVITSMEYTDPSQLSRDSMVQKRNDLMERQIRSGSPGSKMVVNDEDLPLTHRNIMLTGYNTYELRGVWEMTDDFMGGPFVSYFVLSDNLDSIYIIDLFVYAPGEDKREYLQELEHIATSLKIL